MLNDAPILPEEDEEDTISLLKDSPQCVAFGIFMIWLNSFQQFFQFINNTFRFSSITINLGPTFLSGALAANSELHLYEPSCPLVQVYISVMDAGSLVGLSLEGDSSLRF